MGWEKNDDKKNRQSVERNAEKLDILKRLKCLQYFRWNFTNQTKITDTDNSKKKNQQS